MSDDLLMAHDGAVTTLTINRPPLNLMTLSLLEYIVSALEMLRDRDETRAILLTGGADAAIDDDSLFGRSRMVIHWKTAQSGRRCSASTPPRRSGSAAPRSPT